MANQIKNLLGSSDYDFNTGQVYYMVDSDNRTVAQGWAQADGTGPLDLFAARNPNRVFRTEDGITEDDSQLQAAIDEMVDFRGDTLFLTPGAYTTATALTWNVANARLLGPQTAHSRRQAATLTDTVGAGLTVSTDNNEFAYFRCVPDTAQAYFSLSSGADFGFIHHLFYDAQGISASTSTEFVSGAGQSEWLYSDISHVVDAAQGDAYSMTNSVRNVWERCDFYVELTGIAWESVFTFVTSALGNIVRECCFRGCGGATPAVFTNIFTGIANVNSQLLAYHNIVDGTALATVTDFETTFGTATDIEICRNYQSSDASGEGAEVLITLT